MGHVVTTPLRFIFVRLYLMETIFRVLFPLGRPEVTTFLAELLRHWCVFI